MIYVFYGPKGSTKSSCGVSGEGLTVHAELDAGALERARVTGKVESKSFFAPPTFLLDAGRLSTAMVGQSGKGAVQVVHRYQGWREVLGDWTQWYLDNLKRDEVAYVTIDTATKLWLIARNALRQRIQDEVPVDQQGDRLKRLEYEEPNGQFHTICELAHSYKKHLILISHEGEVWKGGEPTGMAKPDGWGEIQDEASIVMRFAVEGQTAFGYIEKGPLGLLGLKMEFPTMPKIEALVEAERILGQKGQQLPKEAEAIIALAAQHK